MHEFDLTSAQWRKSTRSSGNGQCVEVVSLSQSVAVRDSKNPDGPKLIFPSPAWAGLIRRVKAGGSELA
jgi:hypothetical protein